MTYVGSSDRDVLGALLSSISLKMANLSTYFSTIGAISPGPILYTSVVIHSKALSIISFC